MRGLLAAANATAYVLASNAALDLSNHDYSSSAIDRARIGMRLQKTMTARFAAAVEACGSPQVYTLWLPPKKDRELTKQIGQNRIMTILRTDAGSEFGSVGFLERKQAIYLQFPKSLKRFADRRIVGIKWDLVKN